MNKAAEMAGKWWADRLHKNHAGKRDAFAVAVAKRVDMAFNGEAAWDWAGPAKPDGPKDYVFTESDYDPKGLLLDAVREVIDPDCRGMIDRKSTRLNSSHIQKSRMPSSA